MSRDWRTRLEDIVQYAGDAMTLVSGMSFDAFAADMRTQRAVFYSLLVVGEAAKHVPEAIRTRAPSAGWVGAMRFRDRVAHGYRDMNLSAVWDIVTRYLPPLRDDVAALLATLDAVDPPPR